LRKAVDQLTDATATAKGVKYRTPKRRLSFKQALQLYAMTLALVRMETKWADKADSPPPDMINFTTSPTAAADCGRGNGGAAAVSPCRH
jgi:hypothetical protein